MKACRAFDPGSNPGPGAYLLVEKQGSDVGSCTLPAPDFLDIFFWPRLRFNSFLHLLIGFLPPLLEKDRGATAKSPPVECTHFVNPCKNAIDLFGTKRRAHLFSIIPPEPASPHDFNGLQLIKFALTFHFSVSGFAHDFTSFFLPCLFGHCFFTFALGSILSAIASFF
jgi:hypothetical protein